MTNRNEPTNTHDDNNVEQTDVETLAELAEQESSESDTVAIVRHWDAARRTAAIVAAITAGVALPMDLQTTVLTAPTGADPLDAVREWADAQLSNVAAVLAAAEQEHGATLDDVFDVEHAMSAARLAPATESSESTLAAITAPTPTGARRRRRSIARDWTGATGTYRTPGSEKTGRDASSIDVRQSGGVPTFHTLDGRTFSNATAALRHADGWDAIGAAGGWGSPFTVLTRVGGARDGATLGEVTAVAAES